MSANRPKHGQMAVAKTSRPGRLEIVFAAAEASEVFVAGDFNQWNPKGTPLRKDPQGVWRAELQVLPGGHEYRFIVDDQWKDDPQATRFIPNPFGSRNSFVQVT